MRRRSSLVAGICLIAMPVALAACSKLDRRASAGSAVSGSRAAGIDTTIGHAPPGVRIKVEVLNASNNRGAARRATLLLRNRGYDVVAMGTARPPQTPTVVLDRSNHPEWAALITKAIGGTVISRPDTSRYLDITVLLGSDWTPPPMAFHP